MTRKNADGVAERAIEDEYIATYLAATHLKFQHSDLEAGRPMGSGVDIKGSIDWIVRRRTGETVDGATERAIEHEYIATYLAAIHLQLQHSDLGAGRPMGSGVGIEGSTENEFSK